MCFPVSSKTAYFCSIKFSVLLVFDSTLWGFQICTFINISVLKESVHLKLALNDSWKGLLRIFAVIVVVVCFLEEDHFVIYHSYSGRAPVGRLVEADSFLMMPRK